MRGSKLLHTPRNLGCPPSALQQCLQLGPRSFSHFSIKRKYDALGLFFQKISAVILDLRSHHILTHA
eukprot:4046797-Pyramimonas_sp.AAC.1